MACVDFGMRGSRKFLPLVTFSIPAKKRDFTSFFSIYFRVEEWWWEMAKPTPFTPVVPSGTPPVPAVRCSPCKVPRNRWGIFPIDLLSQKAPASVPHSNLLTSSLRASPAQALRGSMINT